MDLLSLLLAARAAATDPDSPDELAAHLGDLARGALVEGRRALLEALTAGYPAAVRSGDSARAAAIAAGLTDRPEREAALAAWRDAIGASAEAGLSRWQVGARLAARGEILLLVAAIRSESAVETLAVSLCRDGRELSCWIDRPSASYLALLARIAPREAALVGYDLPRLLSLLPDDYRALFVRPAMADLATSAEWLRDEGRLAIAGSGLGEMALAAGVPAPNETIGARIDALKAVWFRLLRPRLLD